MKKYMKDVIISFIVALINFYVIYLINGEYLAGDLFAQGLPFIDYFKNNFNIFNGDLIYNWNMALGDSAYSFIIYYLISPFNLILFMFKGFNSVDILPIFITIKIAFMLLFSSMYFEKILGQKYKWIASGIYIASYNIMMYSSLQIMWIDTFIFLPLVLLGIEKVLNKEKCYFYIVTLFLLIITNYYLAALLLPQIFIYGVIRYIFINEFKSIFKFIGKMIGYSIISLLLSSFVLIPAVYYMLNSAKDVNSQNNFINSSFMLFDFVKGNVIGNKLSQSSTYIPTLAMITIVPFALFNKNKKIMLYLIPIALLLLGVYSGKVNYIFNLGYKASGGESRYNILFNIYISLIVCSGLEYLKEYKYKILTFIVASSGIYVYLIAFRGRAEHIDIKYLIFTIVFVILNTFLIWILCFLANKGSRYESLVIKMIAIVLFAEVFLCNIGITDGRNFHKMTYVKNRNSMLSYIGEKYGKDLRIEVTDKERLTNAYLSQNVYGIEGYHSLMGESYKNIGEVFVDTTKNKVVNRVGGRNIIRNFSNVRYYVSPYNYCPYNGFNIIDRYGEYNIFATENKEIKYFNKVDNNLKSLLSERDLLLYTHLYIPNVNKSKVDSKSYMDKLSLYNLDGDSFNVTSDGEYYLRINTVPVEENSKYKIYITINGEEVKDRHYFSKLIDKGKGYSEIYIGYLKKGDKLKFNFNLGENPKIAKIDSEYINSSINKMNSIGKQNIKRDNNHLTANFKMNQKGYAVFPVVYDKQWKFYNYGKQIKPLVVNGGFIAFELDAGENNIEMEFVPYSMYIGFAVTLLTVVILTILYVLRVSLYKKTLVDITG